MCTMLKVQDLINLSMSPPSFASSMGYHHHAGLISCAVILSFLTLSTLKMFCFQRRVGMVQVLAICKG